MPPKYRFLDSYKNKDDDVIKLLKEILYEKRTSATDLIINDF
jgi:hypothetical protein